MPFFHYFQNVFCRFTRTFSTFICLLNKFLIVNIYKLYSIKFRYRFDKYNTIAYITKFLSFCVRRAILAIT